MGLADSTFNCISEEVERLTKAELKAAHQYYEAVSHSDICAAQEDRKSVV